MADSWFPVIHPEVDNHLTQAERLTWVGWDWILRPDILQLTSEIDALFSDLPSARRVTSTMRGRTSGI